MKFLDIKQALYQECLSRVENRYQKIKQAIADIDESLAETTSSSGEDDFDNSRAMLQIDKENSMKQLSEVNVLRDTLNRMDLKSEGDYVRLGSLIFTNNGIYFICLSYGPIEFEGTNYICIALNSPIGQVLRGLKKGDSFQFNEKSYTIKEMH